MTATRADTVTLRSELNAALVQAMDEDSRVLLMGEDVARTGGVFRISTGLLDRFGDRRVIDTPLAEAGLVGVAIGLAMGGLRPVLEIQFDGFLYPAMNQIVSHLAKLPTRYNEPGLLPICLRLPFGGHIRATEHHSESPEAYLAHTPDLRVVAASDPRTARGLLLAAIRSDEPYVVLEPKRFYGAPRVPAAEVLADVDPGKVRMVQEGADAVVIAYGPTVALALEAARDPRLAEASIGVVDAVSLAPIDVEGILSATAKVGRVVVVSEAIRRCSVASEIVARIATDLSQAELHGPPVLACSLDRPYPAAAFEDEYLPSHEDVVAGLQKVLSCG